MHSNGPMETADGVDDTGCVVTCFPSCKRFCFRCAVSSRTCGQFFWDMWRLAFLTSESCVFGLLLALFSVTSALTVHIRWKQVKTFYRNDAPRVLRRANNISLVMGHIAAFGVLVVANFQETNVVVVHLIGAFLAFVVGTVYAWVQTFITYKTVSLPGHRSCLRHIRLVVSAVCTVCTLLVVVFANIATNKRLQVDKDFDRFKWSPDNEGFNEHVTSTTLEWALAFMSVLFFATFSFEFRHFTVALPVEFTVFSTEVKDEAVTNDNVENGRFTASRELETSAVFTVSSENFNKD